MKLRHGNCEGEWTRRRTHPERYPRRPPDNTPTGRRGGTRSTSTFQRGGQKRTHLPRAQGLQDNRRRSKAHLQSRCNDWITKKSLRIQHLQTLSWNRLAKCWSLCFTERSVSISWERPMAKGTPKKKM